MFSEDILPLDRLKQSLLDKFQDFLDAEGSHCVTLQGSDRAAADIFNQLKAICINKFQKFV